MPRRLTRRASALLLLATAAALSACVTPTTAPSSSAGATPPPGQGTVTTLTLPAGEYEVFSYSAMSGAWGGLRAVQAQTPFSRRFRVVDGEVTYIGHVAVVVRGDAGTLPSAGGALLLPAQVTVKDEAAQDLKDIGERIGGMTAERVRVRLAQ